MVRGSRSGGSRSCAGRGVHPRERMRDVIAEFLGDWESARYEPQDVIWTFRGEDVVRLALFQDRDEAVAAAGVER